MSAHVATLLALVGVALAAIAIFAPHRPPPPSPAVSALLHPAAREPDWARALDAGPAANDVEVRLALIAALGELASAWSQAALEDAVTGDPDGRVRAAAGAALAGREM